MTKTVLVTGGAGFIGSHACKQLACQGFKPVIYDDLSKQTLANLRYARQSTV